MLVICGTYQLFGHRFTTKDGDVLEGIGIFDAETVGGDVRLIGNVVAESRWGQIVGFENHSGQTNLSPNQEPFARVVTGHGNTEKSGYEGAVRKNAIGTYLHGSLLPKNPKLADYFLSLILSHRGLSEQLKPRDDSLELAAALEAARRPNT